MEKNSGNCKDEKRRGRRRTSLRLEGKEAANKKEKGKKSGYFPDTTGRDDRETRRKIKREGRSL